MNTNAEYKAAKLNERLNARFRGMELIHAYYDADLDLIAVHGRAINVEPETFYYGPTRHAYDLLNVATNDLVEFKCESMRIGHEKNLALIESRKDSDPFYAEMWAKYGPSAA
jgi:hypothetical protein